MTVIDIRVDLKFWHIIEKKEKNRKNERSFRTSHTQRYIHAWACFMHCCVLLCIDARIMCSLGGISSFQYLLWTLQRTNFLNFRQLSLKLTATQVMQTFLTENFWCQAMIDSFCNKQCKADTVINVQNYHWEKCTSYVMTAQAYFHVSLNSFVNNDKEHVSWRTSCSKVNKLAKLNKLTFWLNSGENVSVSTANLICMLYNNQFQLGPFVVVRKVLIKECEQYKKV